MELIKWLFKSQRNCFLARHFKWHQNTCWNMHSIRKTLKSQLKETQQQTEVPLHAWETLGIDLLELNKENFLLVVDYYSRFPVLSKLNSLSKATTVIHLKQIFSEYGISKTVVTDGGPQFNTEFQDFAKLWCFQHIKSSSHHLQHNGLAERIVKTAKATLIKTMASQDDPHIALLIYWATTINHSLPSPAVLHFIALYTNWGTWGN